MSDGFKSKFNQVFSEEEIKEMKNQLEQYENTPIDEEFTLPTYYYMTIIRKVVGLSKLS